MAEQKDWRQQLCDRYPFLRHGGFPSVGDGWRSILERMCADLAEEIKASNVAEYRIVQIKEKFGGLRAYYSYDGEKVERLREIVRTAENDSLVTCEACGKPGEVRLPKAEPYWYKCCCMKHYLKWPDNYY
ncbi:hypothetical protein [Pleomorphomonas carboxyditropha]|uniref:Uncharacterized protein n=1 Tax=Pleomorphomonas carboxyditropha TaxID=2023338 RepID=A0A2G9X147_9HYPH|nr:hypothetical protein [Pleomorphomonas carboxyditropha]PIP00655.1 hypothetical protein CJ014_00700 [Pleomorphomonas carboxyditropha]